MSGKFLVTKKPPTKFLSGVSPKLQLKNLFGCAFQGRGNILFELAGLTVGSDSRAVVEGEGDVCAALDVELTAVGELDRKSVV